MKAMLEKEEYRGHIHKLARALKRHQVRWSCSEAINYVMVRTMPCMAVVMVT